MSADTTPAPSQHVTAGDEGLWHFWNEKARKLAEENAELRAGIKRLSDEEELCAETTGDDPFSMVYLAAKLAAVEHDLAGAKHVAKNALSDLQYWRSKYEELSGAPKPHMAPADLKPFMYGIMCPDGTAYLDEICVDSNDSQTLLDVIEDQELKGHTVVPLYLHPLTPRNHVTGSITNPDNSVKPVDPEDEAYEIGKRDGYSEAVQQIDLLTGGDGEYRYCTDHDPDRHTPGPAEMIQRIVDRFEVLNLLDDATKTGRDEPDDGTAPKDNVKDQNMLEKAIRFATEAHSGQVDKTGAPYIFHPLRVASTFADETMQIIAVLHDVIEDCDVTHADLEREFSLEVADAVLTLSRSAHEPYTDFVRRVGENPIARLVKIADIRDNLRPGADRLRPRYEDALRILDADPPQHHVPSGDEGLWHFWNEKARKLAEENAELRAGIKRLSEEEELCGETMSEEDAFDLVAMAAKLAKSEADRADQWRLRRDAEGSRDAVRAAADSLRMERDQLRKALEPFARFFKSELHDLSVASDATIFAAFQDQATGAPLADLSIADVRRAYDALSSTTEGQP